jgi:hypothetical protein
VSLDGDEVAFYLVFKHVKRSEFVDSNV